MSFNRWQTESDTRIAKVVVSLPAGATVRGAVTVSGPWAGHEHREVWNATVEAA